MAGLRAEGVHQGQACPLLLRQKHQLSVSVGVTQRAHYQPCDSHFRVVSSRTRTNAGKHTVTHTQIHKNQCTHTHYTNTHTHIPSHTHTHWPNPCPKENPVEVSETDKYHISAENIFPGIDSLRGLNKFYTVIGLVIDLITKIYQRAQVLLYYCILQYMRHRA